MRHRPAAGGTIDHTLIGLLSMALAVLVGIGGGVLSLLLLWPGLGRADSIVRTMAEAHVPLLVFFAAIPASLGGLAVAFLPGQVGARRSAFPALDVAALGSTIAALVALVGGLCGLGRVGIGASVDLLALSAVFSSANLITTALIERRIAYAALPSFAWTVLIAAALALCAAPIMAAICSMAVWRGTAAQSISSGLLWPALCVVMVLLLGLVTDILTDVTRRPSVATSAIPALLGGGMLVLFMIWAYCQENRISLGLADRAAEGVLLLLVMPVVLFWSMMLVRASRPLAPGGLPALFAGGFVLTMLIGLVGGSIGVASHEAISLAIVFGLLAGFFRMTGASRNPVAAWLAQAQFWLLLGGSLSLLLPVPPFLRALGAAMSSLSIGLFVVQLIAVLVRSNDERGRDAAVADRVALQGGRLP